MPINLRRLESSHFAFYRAYLEGSEALDLPALADRYLNCGRDPRRVRALLRWLQDELAAAARRNGDWEALRLLRLPKSLGQKGDGSDASTTPSLADFAAQIDPDNVFGEAELIALYRERYPKAGDRGGRATKAARLRERRLTALRRLQHIAVDAPLPAHAVDGWFDENVVTRMHRAGIVSLAQLCETINGFGVRWYRHIPQLGPVGAARIVRWVQANAESLGNVVARLRPDAPSMDIPSIRTARVQGQGSIAPIEQLAETGLAADVSGATGSNRGSLAEQTIAATTDIEAILAWLDAQAASPHTCRAYRTQAERILLWAVVECGKPLSSLRRADIDAYRVFMKAPPATWIAPRHTPRWSVRWRPFAGPLTDSSRATAENVLKALFRWLVTVGYLQVDPWRVAREGAVADGTESSDVASIHKPDSGARVDALDTRMRLRTERRVESRQWQALTHFVQHSNDESDLRAFCMLTLSQFVGLRLQELSALRVCDVSPSTKPSVHATVSVITQRSTETGEREAQTRIVEIPSQAMAILRRYLDARPASRLSSSDATTQPLFARFQAVRRAHPERMSEGDDAIAIGHSPSSNVSIRAASKHATGSDRPMHPAAMARTISAFLERAAASVSTIDAVMSMSLRKIRTGHCRHSFTRTALLASVPVVQLQAMLGLRSTTTIDAHRRALAAVSDGVGHR